MSSEQRYDFSYYEQLVQHDLPDLDLFDLPNLDLFGDSTTTSVIANSPDNLQEHGSVNLQQVGHHFKALDAAEQSQQFKMPYSTAGNNFETDAFAMPQPSASNAFAPLDDPAATFNTAAQSVFGVGNSHSPDDESQSFDNAAGHGHLGGLEAAQTSPLGIHGIPSTSQVTTNNDANAKLRTQSHVPRIEPIDVSFFFRPTLTRRTGRAAHDFHPRTPSRYCQRHSQELVWAPEMSLARLCLKGNFSFSLLFEGPHQEYPCCSFGLYTSRLFS